MEKAIANIASKKERRVSKQVSEDLFRMELKIKKESANGTLDPKDYFKRLY